MTFSRISGRRLRHACACLAAIASLASCGGGTEQFETFVAGRVFAFGDENSALTATGQKYSVPSPPSRTSSAIAVRRRAFTGSHPAQGR